MSYGPSWRHVSGKEILEQSLINEKTSEFESLEWAFNGEIYERVLEFSQLIGKCWFTIWRWDTCPIDFEFLAK